MDRLLVKVSSLASFSREHFITSRIVANAGNHLLPLLQCHGNAEHGVSVSEIRGAIERINVPSVFAPSVTQSFFFAKNIMAWPKLTNTLANQRLGFAVSGRDQIRLAFIFNLDV